MIILLSPAKSLDFESASRITSPTSHIFPLETMRLVRILKKKKFQELAGLMGISEQLARLNVSRFKTFKKDYALGESKPAIEAFNGDVYLGFDQSSLPVSDIEYAQEHIRIISGLYGILKPKDKIQAYRLEMGTRLENKLGSNLYHFWGNKIAKAINKELKEKEETTILNLASNEYFKAVDKKTIKADIINVDFKEDRGGELKFISFTAKKARGLMARYVIKNKIENIEDLKGFDLDGYYFKEDLSSSKSFLFVK